MVADLTRMDEWSPENDGASWLDGATGAAPGADLQGDELRGPERWSTAGHGDRGGAGPGAVLPRHRRGP